MIDVLSISLVIVGLASSLAYSALGIAAARHLIEPSDNERLFGWTLLWFIDEDRYTDEGKRLCNFGGLWFIIGGASWIAWFSGVHK